MGKNKFLSNPIFLEEMRWPDVEELLKRTKLILVPTGSIEQHGPHLPLYSDVVAPLEVSILLAKQLGTVVAPSVRPGVSAHHMPFAGTITLQAQTFIAVVKDYARSLASHGFDPIIFINGHGGNSAALSIATAESRNELSPTKVIGFNWWDFIPKELGKGLSFEDGFHANAQETSWTLYLRPDQVRMERAKREMPEASESIKMSESFYASTFRTFKDVTSSGILGDATKANKEWGKEMIEGAANNIAQAINDFMKNMTY
jgi:creatinine amidohydrolase